MSDDANDGRADDRTVLLAERLVGLVGSLAEDADSSRLADRLTADCTDLLDVDGVGVLLSDPDGAIAASSEQVTRLLASANRHGTATWSPDDLRGHGFADVHSLPLRHAVHTVGVLHLLLADRPRLTPSELAVAEALAGAAAITVVHRRRLAVALTRAEQLQGALDSRIVVEQATGVLSEYAGIGMGAAFDALRHYARSGRLKLSDVADQVVTRRLAPGEVVQRRQS